MNEDREWVRSALQEFRHELEDLRKNEIRELRKIIQGDPDQRFDSGGLRGEIVWLRDELSKRDKQLEVLEDQLEKLVNRERPRWWDWVIVGGGLCIAIVAVVQVFLVILLYRVLQ